MSTGVAATLAVGWGQTAGEVGWRAGLELGWSDGAGGEEEESG